MNISTYKQFATAYDYNSANVAQRNFDFPASFCAKCLVVPNNLLTHTHTHTHTHTQAPSL